MKVDHLFMEEIQLLDTNLFGLLKQNRHQGACVVNANLSKLKEKNTRPKELRGSVKSKDLNYASREIRTI